MRILAIETSCDDTAVAIIEAKEIKQIINFEILGNDVSSQTALHTQYGGVFPMMAKREHGKNIFNVFKNVLEEAEKVISPKELPPSALLPEEKPSALEPAIKEKLKEILERESDLSNIFIKNISKIKKPGIDAIAVTTGPGLEPALWVGINFAKALSEYWNLPVIPVNHMEGHLLSIFPKEDTKFTIDKKENIFPILSLLVSGGHTELILVEKWQKYKKIGQTRDDAAGEAFDKVARMLGLPYPGGPEISKLAEKIRKKGEKIKNKRFSKLFKFLGPRMREDEEPDRKNSNNLLPLIKFPRPMIHSKDYDFSFSGLKTAVLYYLRDNKNANKAKVAKEFEDAVIETLVTKTIKAIKEYQIKTLIVAGGVSANIYLQKQINNKIKEENLNTKVHFPTKALTGDNAIMIAIAGYFQYQNKKYTKNYDELVAKGNLSL